MKIKNSILLVSIVAFFAANNATAQCGATGVSATPQPVIICEGSSTVIDLAAGGPCTGAFEYQIMNGAWKSIFPDEILPWF